MTIRPLIYLSFLAGACWLCACANRAAGCDYGDIQFVDDFAGARLNGCEQLSESEYRLIIEPENIPINDSPWFAFQIKKGSSQSRKIHLTMLFKHGPSRYLPKISDDGSHWRVIPHQSQSQQLQFELELTQSVLWIAAQELVTEKDYSSWIENHRHKANVETEIIGHSVLGRPIEALYINPQQRDTVIILGRQHPPEVTGALALFPFVDTLLAPSAISQAFAQRFKVVVIPNLNPDGVFLGNWRHNANGVDTNRDWGEFTQPETQAVATLLSTLKQSGHHFYLGLDFHSTGNNFFYTQEDEDPLCPAEFTRQWIQTIQVELPDYAVKRSARTSNGNPTFKQWFNTEYAVPSISFELGDNIDRALIPAVGETAANAMMKELLDSQCSRAQ